MAEWQPFTRTCTCMHTLSTCYWRPRAMLQLTDWPTAVSRVVVGRLSSSVHPSHALRFLPSLTPFQLPSLFFARPLYPPLPVFLLRLLPFPFYHSNCLPFSSIFTIKFFCRTPFLYFPPFGRRNKEFSWLRSSHVVYFVTPLFGFILLMQEPFHGHRTSKVTKWTTVHPLRARRQRLSAMTVDHSGRTERHRD